MWSFISSFLKKCSIRWKNSSWIWYIYIYSGNHFDPCYGRFRFIPRGMNIKSSVFEAMFSSHQSYLSWIYMNINVAYPPVWIVEEAIVCTILCCTFTREKGVVDLVTRCNWSLSCMKCLFVWQLTLWHATNLLCNYISMQFPGSCNRW